MKSQAIVYHTYGAPQSVAHLEEIELPELRPHEVLVRMELAPINPADLNTLEGVYGVRPSLPAVAGGEGLGVVEALGSEVREVALGARVLPQKGVGTWSARCVADAAGLIVVPDSVASEQAAMLRINPATALRMLTDFESLAPGDWVLQNASNSGVGRSLIQIAHSRGVRTLNVVRRPELIDELRALGADSVLVEGDSLSEEIVAVTEGAPIRLALNAVGGESALRLAGALAESGTLVTYGAMGRQPVRIPNGLLIFKDLRVRGFWVSRWYERSSAAQRTVMFEELFELSRRGVLQTPVEKIYPLEDIEAALIHAKEARRGGKILLAPGGLPPR